MGKHTDEVVYPNNASAYSGDWSNVTNVRNESTSSYAESKSLIMNEEIELQSLWSAATIGIPKGATVNNIKVVFVVKVSSAGTGQISNIYYGYKYTAGLSDSNFPYSANTDLGFDADFTTLSYTLPTISNDLITNGLTVKIKLSHNRFSVQTIKIATTKILVTYTLPDITYTYVDYDGTVLKTQTVEEGTSPTAPSNPTRPSTAEYEYTFSGWSLSGTTYTAQYTATKRKYLIRVLISPEEAGYAVLNSWEYEYGKEVTLTVDAYEGYKFVKWEDGSTGEITDSGIQRTITVTGAKDYTAYFEKVETSKIYIGTKKVVAVYCGTQKISVYCGTQKLI